MTLESIKSEFEQLYNSTALECIRYFRGEATYSDTLRIYNSNRERILYLKPIWNELCKADTAQAANTAEPAQAEDKPAEPRRTIILFNEQDGLYIERPEKQSFTSWQRLILASVKWIAIILLAAAVLVRGLAV